MNLLKALLHTLIGASHLLRPTVVAAQPGAAADPAHAPSPAPVLVPIRSIGPRERERVLTHLLALSARDRYLRFGYAASDEHIQRYVHEINFERDEIFGIYNRRLELIAVAHLAFAPAEQPRDCAEFGVSVAEHARGRGYGARLFERAVVSARNEGVGMLFIHALSENAAMLAIARNAGATVESSGPEAEAFMRLPQATLDSRMNEIALDHYAEVDYQLKSRANNFWAFLTSVQEARRLARSSSAGTPQER